MNGETAINSAPVSRSERRSERPISSAWSNSARSIRSGRGDALQTRPNSSTPAPTSRPATCMTVVSPRRSCSILKSIGVTCPLRGACPRRPTRQAFVVVCLQLFATSEELDSTASGRNAATCREMSAMDTQATLETQSDVDVMFAEVSADLLAEPVETFETALDRAIERLVLCFDADRGSVLLFGPDDAPNIVASFSREGVPSLRKGPTFLLPNWAQLALQGHGFAMRQPDELPEAWTAEREFVRAQRSQVEPHVAAAGRGQADRPPYLLDPDVGARLGRCAGGPLPALRRDPRERDRPFPHGAKAPGKPRRDLAPQGACRDRVRRPEGGGPTRRRGSTRSSGGAPPSVTFSIWWSRSPRPAPPSS